MIQCTVCNQNMPQHELPDHAIAHTVHQQIIENQHVRNIAEVQQFFENEELEVETSTTKVRGLTRDEIKDLPQSLFDVQQPPATPKKRSVLELPDSSSSEESEESSEDEWEPEQRCCMVCLHNFCQDEMVRGLRCLHIFHSKCIDNWLIKSAVCPICRVIQYKKTVQFTPRNQQRP